MFQDPCLRYTGGHMSFQTRRLKEEAPPSFLSKSFGWVRRLRLPAIFLWRHAAEAKKEKEASTRRHFIQRILVIMVAILCVLLLTASAVHALVKLQVLRIPDIVRVAGVPLPKDEQGHTNLLLLGQGDQNHDGVDLTDTIMIASIDPATDSVAMISLPRDLYLRTSRMGAGRINALYRDFKYYLMQNENLEEAEAGRAAMQELTKELGDIFGIELHRVVKVDFIGFVQAVDALGGIDIDVPEDLYDTQYPGPNYSYQTFSVMAGPQHMDGETALKYARSRHSTSDFDRSRRQQLILQALKEKAATDGTLTNPSRITSLLQILREHVATTLTFREMISLAELGSNTNRDNIVSVQFGLDGPGGFLYPPPMDQYGGASVLVPTSWDDVRSFVALVMMDRALFLDDTPIDVLNAGAPSGSSRYLGYELIRYTLPVERMENYEGDDRATSAILAPDGHLEAARSLSVITGIADVAPLPETSTGTTIQILLGEDYIFSPIMEITAPPEEPADEPQLPL